MIHPCPPKVCALRDDVDGFEALLKDYNIPEHLPNPSLISQADKSDPEHFDQQKR